MYLCSACDRLIDRKWGVDPTQRRSRCCVDTCQRAQFSRLCTRVVLVCFVWIG